jgi:hypothetical protein
MTQGPAQGEEPRPDAAPEQSADNDVRLNITPDRMAITLTYPRVPTDIQWVIDIVRRQLKELGVPDEWRGPVLERKIRQAAENASSFDEAVIVEGDPEIPPVDGKVEWAGSFFATGYVEDEKGQVDYRKPLAATAVEAGQHLATLIPPEHGKNGRDVFGRILPARKGAWINLIPGDSVREDKATHKFYATTSGRIRLNGTTLSVDQLYVVEGNVGLGTGDISHGGAVVVHGDVESGSSILARGDIEVHGTVENADIMTGGNLHVRGGIAGRGKKKMVIAGRLQARYIIDCEVEVGKDVVVEREIMQSFVKTRGALAMQHGRMVGGKIIALSGVLVGQLGSEAGIPTIVYAGHDFKLEEKIQAIQKQIEEVETRRDTIKETLAPALQKEAKLPSEAREALDKLKKELDGLEQTIKEYQAEMAGLKKRSISRSRPRVEISRRIFAETTFYLGEEVRKISDDIAGPVHILLMGNEVRVRRGLKG